MYDAVALLKESMEEGDVVVTVGAGDVSAVGEMLVEVKEKRVV